MSALIEIANRPLAGVNPGEAEASCACHPPPSQAVSGEREPGAQTRPMTIGTRQEHSNERHTTEHS